jgi:hypothetical protein
MKNRPKIQGIESHLNPPRRRLLGVVAGGIAGLVGLKLGRREQAMALPSTQDSSTDERRTREPSRAAIVVKPAPHSVKRHG